MIKHFTFLLIFLILFAMPAFAEKKLAVLPFEVLSEKTDIKQFGIGTTETLAAGLTNIKELILIDRGDLQKVLKEQAFQNSNFSEQETSVKIGKILGAEILLTGTIQYFDNQFRISSKFIDVQSSKVLKATTVTGANIFELQDKLIKEFIDNQGFIITEQQQQNITKIIKATDSTDAYQFYIKANELYWKVFFDYGFDHNISEKEGIEFEKKAIENFDKALNIDPNYSLALAGKAKMEAIWVYYHGGTPENEKKIIESAEITVRKAMGINSSLWEIYNTLNLIYFLKEEDYYKAIDSKDEGYKKAIAYGLKANEINPHNREIKFVLSLTYLAYGRNLAANNHCDEAITNLKEIEKYDREIMKGIGVYAGICEAKKHISKGEKIQALEIFQYLLSKVRVLINGPFIKDISDTYISVANDYYKESKYDKALELYQEALNYKIETPNIYNNIGAIYFMMKDYKKASENYEQAIKLNPMNPDYYQNLGTVLELLGDKKKAVAVFKTGCGLGKKELCKQ